MADYTITARNGPYLKGSLWEETGRFSSGGAAGTIRTKLGSIVFYCLQSLNGVNDNGFTSYINSASESATADDPGCIYCTATLTSGEYLYKAVGIR